MSIKFKKGAAVRQVVKPVEGDVRDQTIINDEIVYLVGYVGADGEAHERWFRESELEEVVQADPAPAGGG